MVSKKQEGCAKGNISAFNINNGKTTKVLQNVGNPIPKTLSNLDGFIYSISNARSTVKARITNREIADRRESDWKRNWEMMQFVFWNVC